MPQSQSRPLVNPQSGVVRPAVRQTGGHSPDEIGEGGFLAGLAEESHDAAHG
jgi:hypothetical protein